MKYLYQDHSDGNRDILSFFKAMLRLLGSRRRDSRVASVPLLPKNPQVCLRPQLMLRLDTANGRNGRLLVCYRNARVRSHVRQPFLYQSGHRSAAQRRKV